MPSVFQTAVTCFEYALALCGLVYSVVCLCWLFFSVRGRVARVRPAALMAWDVTLSDFLLLGWFMLSFGFVGQLLLRIIAGPLSDTRSDSQTLQLLLYGTMFHFGAVLTWPVARALARRRRAVASQPSAPTTPGSVIQVVRGGSLTFLIVMPLALGAGFFWERFLQAVGLPTDRQELVDLFAQTKSPALFAFLITLALVLAPVAEELVFRAGIFRFLRSRTPRWVAFVVSAGLFASLHGNWVSSLPLFILGLVFAAGYERTGRIAVPMLAHALFNLNTLLLVLSGVGG
jgi:hypothetical protein